FVDVHFVPATAVFGASWTDWHRAFASINICSNCSRMVWSLAYATRLGKAVAGVAYMRVLWSYRRLHCWTYSLIESDGRLRGNNRALLLLA
ncbi:hypothetical protein HID58_092163, partial [Brassica napus]